MLIELEERLLNSLVPTGGFQELLNEINTKEAEVQEYARLVIGESTADPINVFESATLTCDFPDDNFRDLELRKILGAYDDHLKRTYLIPGIGSELFAPMISKISSQSEGQKLNTWLTEEAKKEATHNPGDEMS